MCPGVFVVRIKRAFTLIELVVAVGLLAMMLVFAGSIFRASIGAQRTAGANADIMQKLRAITDQLNADFKGLRKDAPLLVWFQYDPNTGERFDQIMFFADGDFQSTQPYDDIPPGAAFVPADTGVPVVSNVARIYYGQADLFDYQTSPRSRIEHYYLFNTLARRRHLLTADPDVYAFPTIITPADFFSTFNAFDNDMFEHDSIVLAVWQALFKDADYNSTLISTCFGNRPGIDLYNDHKEGLHMLLSQQVSSFSVQWGYRFYNPLAVPVIDRYLWWPSADMDGDGFDDDPNDFSTMQSVHILLDYAFGIYLNLPGGLDPIAFPNWFKPDFAAGSLHSFGPRFFPDALKFTFTLHDSKGFVRQGQTFTHIVYLDD